MRGFGAGRWLYDGALRGGAQRRTPRSNSSSAPSSWGNGGSRTRSSASGARTHLGARGFDVDFGLGSALLDTGQEAAAIVELERAAALQPRHAGVLQNLAKAQYLLGLVDQAVASFRAALAVNDDFLHRSALATVIPGAPSATHADVLAARRAFAENDLPAPRFRFSPERSPGPLRVGYLSSFFKSANWMKPVWGLVNEHDRTGFAVHLLSAATEEDARPPDTGRILATRS